MGNGVQGYGAYGQMMVTKNPQNVHRKYFWAILMTFISDVKIDVNMCEPHYVYLFFLWTSSIVQMFDYLTFDIFLTTWHLFDILTSFWYFGCKSPMGPIAHLPIPLYPIAHVPHCPCDPLPMWPIALVPHTPCALLPMCPIPLYPIPPVPPLPIGPMAYTPCTLYPLYTIAPSFWHFDTFNLNHLSPHRAIFSSLAHTQNDIYNNIFLRKVILLRIFL